MFSRKRFDSSAGGVEAGYRNQPFHKVDVSVWITATT
jgi:hypothetical protein